MNNYVVKMITTSGKTRYYCYNDGSGFNTTFFIDSAARLTKKQAQKEVKNFTNAKVVLFVDEKKKRFEDAQKAIDRMEKKEETQQQEDSRLIELEKYWGKDSSKKTNIVVDYKQLCKEVEKPKINIKQDISKEIENIITSLKNIREFLSLNN